jgi:hypothetical protein
MTTESKQSAMDVEETMQTFSAHVAEGDAVEVLWHVSGTDRDEWRTGFTVTGVVTALDAPYRVNVEKGSEYWLELHPDCIRLAPGPNEVKGI